jgi:Flp pilus assembly protein TadG
MEDPMSRRRFWRDTRGAEVAELAAVLPLLFMVLLTIFWFARAFNIHAAVTRAAQEGAKIAAASSCATCAPQSIAAQNSAIDASVTDTLRAAGLDPANVSPYPVALPTFCTSNAWAGGGCTTTTGQVRVCRGVLLNPGATGNAQECGAMVGFQYPYRFNVPTVDVNAPFIQSEVYDLGMKAAVQNRVEYLCWQSSGC